jgi:hypothetical protein
VLGSNCFAGIETLQSVLFENGSELIRIEDSAFSGSSILSICIPSTCTSFGWFAFAHSLCTVITFQSPSRFVEFGTAAFKESRLQQLNIPSGVVNIPEECFSGCVQLTSLTFEPSSQLAVIGPSAFAKARIKSLVLPASLSFIDESAWLDSTIESVSVDCHNPYFTTSGSILISSETLVKYVGISPTVEIPANVQTIAKSAFESYQTLTSVIFQSPSQTRSIEASAFANSSLAKIIIPASVESICSSCFAKCLSLQSVTFEEPSRLRVIEQSAFAHSSLTEICLPSSVVVLGPFCFHASRIVKVTFPVGFQWVASSSQLKDLPDHVFASTTLATFVIPATVESIASTAFAETTCQSISVDRGNKHFKVENGILYSINNSNLIRCFLAHAVIVIPGSVEVLGSHSFSNLKNLQRIDFEKGLRLRRIEKSAFQSSSITSIVIPSSVEIICGFAFAHTPSLTDISFESGSQLKRIEESAFWSSSLRQICIPSKVEFIGPKCFAESKSLSKLTFAPNCELLELSLELISGTSIYEICIPSHVSFLTHTTVRLPQLTSVMFEKGSELARIDAAFFGSSIRFIKFPQSVEIIGAHCFQECNVLERIEFDMNSNLQHLDPSAFSQSSVSLIVVPSRISSLFACAIPPRCHLEVLKIRQSRTFNLDEWLINLNDYQDCGFLNRGTVRLLKHRTTHDPIVVKAFKSVAEVQSPIQPDVQFQREIETMITLRHPCVVAMQGWCRSNEDQSAQLVLEYLSPPSLKQLLHKPTQYEWWTSTAKVKAIIGIVQGMTFIHSRNLMHRELKTRSIFFDQEHCVKIGGFGRSKFDDLDVLKHTMFCDSMSFYQAPEMWGSDYTNSVDVYSFAMILFRIVTGHSPFPEMRGKSPMARMQRVIQGRRADIDNVVPFVRSLIDGCWAHDPTTRPTFAKIMEILDQENFRIFEDVNSEEVRRYIESIRVRSQLL